RTTLEWSGSFSRTTGELNSEFQHPVTQRFLGGSVRGEYELTHRAIFLASLSAQQRRYDTGGLSPDDRERLTSLDGSDLAISAGIRYEVNPHLSAGMQYERGRFTFVRSATLRDNDSDGVMLTATHEGPRLALTLF